jgi:hypothetical protein
MTPDRLKTIDDRAVAGTGADPFTTQALVATIRTQDRAIAEQRDLILTLRALVKAAGR